MASDGSTSRVGEKMAYMDMRAMSAYKLSANDSQRLAREDEIESDEEFKMDEEFMIEFDKFTKAAKQHLEAQKKEGV